jgi:hypothetical protein
VPRWIKNIEVRESEEGLVIDFFDDQDPVASFFVAFEDAEAMLATLRASMNGHLS